MIRIIPANRLAQLLARRVARLNRAEGVVRPILEAVRKRGDKALVQYARKLDGLDRSSVRVSERELAAADAALSPAFRAALHTASRNIRAYARLQLPQEWMQTLGPGLRLGPIVRPLETIPAYIPAGRYPLPSTLMMTVIPAQVAGVPNICVACPRPVAEIFGAAHRLGVSQVFQM